MCATAIFNSRCINGLREVREDSQFEPEMGDGDGKHAMEFSNRRSIFYSSCLLCARILERDEPKNSKDLRYMRNDEI